MHERYNCHFSNLIWGEELSFSSAEESCRSETLSIQPEGLLFYTTCSGGLNSDTVFISTKYCYSFPNFTVVFKTTFFHRSGNWGTAYLNASDGITNNY